MTKHAIVYFSRPGMNFMNGKITPLEVGNTKRVAELIHACIGAPLYPIEMISPYSSDYAQCTTEALEDQKRDARPPIVQLPNLDDVDVLWLGTPVYWETMPQCVFTFLESVDLSNMTIHLFITHEGSGEGRIREDIYRICPEACIQDVLPIFGHQISLHHSTIENWAKLLYAADEHA